MATEIASKRQSLSKECNLSLDFEQEFPPRLRPFILCAGWQNFKIQENRGRYTEFILRCSPRKASQVPGFWGSPGA